MLVDIESEGVGIVVQGSDKRTIVVDMGLVDMNNVISKCLLMIVLVVAMMLIPVRGASGNTLTVGPTGDYATVRSAIVAAQDNDTIVITTNVHMEAGIVVSNRVNLTIMGSTLNPADTIVQASNAYDIATDRVFWSKTNCTFRNLTIRFGRIPGSGGGIYTDSKATVVVSNCVVTLNRATTGTGGGIFGADNLGNNAMLIYDTTVSDNTAANSGGGIQFGGNNICGAKVYNSTISGNVSTNFGGGIVANAGPLELYNSTVCLNVALGTAPTGGGGLALRGANIIRNCTIVSNACPSGYGGGIGIWAGASSQTLTMESSILAANTAGLGGPDMWNNAAAIVEKYNLVGITNGNTGVRFAAGSPNANGSYIGDLNSPVIPGVLPLADNGGPTMTCALQADSVAVNHGTNSQGLVYDQRGNGYARTNGVAVDIGAYEDIPATLVYSKMVFSEVMPANDGSINNSDPVLIALLKDTFTGADNDVFDSTKVQAVNLPSNLTAVVTRLNSRLLSVLLTGNAELHEGANNVSDLGLVFLDGAFTGGSAAVVTNASISSLAILFANAGDENSRKLSFSGTTFNEAVVYNDGRIDNDMPITITISNGTFTGNAGDDFAAGPTPKVVVSNLPNGLTAVVTRATSDMKLVVTLTGKAVFHNSVSNVNALTFAFDDSAFVGGNAAGVAGASTDMAIAFSDPTITWAGNGFVEKMPDNNGAVVPLGMLTATLKGDLFTGAISNTMEGKFSSLNVPSGLSVVVAKLSDTMAAVFMNGNADAHTNGNDIADLAVTFGDTAFGMGGAAAVSGYSRTGLVVDFKDPNKDLYVSSTNASDVTGDGTMELPYATIAKAVRMSAAGDTIRVQPGVLTENNILLTNAYLTVMGNSMNPADTIVQASNNFDIATDRVFDVRTNSTLRNMTIRYGKKGAAGGGVQATAELLVSNCVITLNKATGNGGGINSSYSAVICDSMISDNQGSGGGGVCGGQSVPSSLSITNSTIARNTSTADGGGVYCYVINTSKLVNCTIYGNSANGTTGKGGGIYSAAPGGAIMNCTIYSNAAPGSSATGGGIYNGNSSLVLMSTILAGNACATGRDFYAFSTRVSEKYNVVGVTNCANDRIFSVTNGTYVGTPLEPIDAKLLPLANNRGATWTCALQSDSVAIDHGTNTLELLYDQRGPGYKRVVGEQADIGAFEFGAGSSDGLFLILH